MGVGAFTNNFPKFRDAVAKRLDRKDNAKFINEGPGLHSIHPLWFVFGAAASGTCENWREAGQDFNTTKAFPLHAAPA